MNFEIQILSESNSGNSYFVKVNEKVSTPFGPMTTELGIGYITKVEGAKTFEKGDKVNWTGNVQFSPITDNNGVTAMVNGQYLHRVNLVSSELPFIAPVKATVVTAAVKPVEATDGGVPADGDKPF